MSTHIIWVAQQKGGAEKTTLVCNLATACPAEGKSVAPIGTPPSL